jgi:hypothetical protein
MKIRSALLCVIALVPAACREAGIEPRVPEPGLLTHVSSLSHAGTVGAMIAESLAVRLTDVRGHPIENAAVAWSVTAGAGTLSAPNTRTDRQGVARVAWTLGRQPGENGATAAHADLDAVVFTAVGKPDSPAVIAAVSDTVLAGPVGSTVAGGLAVRVTDQHGWSVEGARVSFSVVAGDGALSAADVTTDAEGLARVEWTLGTVAGDQRVQAQAEAGAVAFRAVAVPGEAVAVRWAPDAASQLAAGDSVALNAWAEDRFGNVTADAVTLSLEADTRWVGHFAVIDPHALERRMLIGRTQGQATLLASSVSLAAEPFVLSVVHGSPVLYEVDVDDVVQPSDTVVLWGYGLSDVMADIRVAGAPVDVLSYDSASVRFQLPPPPTDCAGAGRVVLQPGTAGVLPGADLRLRRHRADEQTLQPGSSIRLPSGRDGCVRLAPTSGAEYLVAFIDGRPILRAQAEREPYQNGFADWRTLAPEQFFAIRFSDRAPRPGAAVADAAQMPALWGERSHDTPDVVFSPADPTLIAAADTLPYFTAHTRPWNSGDRGIFEFMAPEGCSANHCWGSVRTQGPGTVLRVYGQRIAVVLPDQVIPQVGSETGYLDMLDEYMPQIIEHGVPFLQATLGEAWPETGSTGQVVVVLGHGTSAFALSDGFGSVWAQINVLFEGRGVSSRMTMAHELTHLWQMKHLRLESGASHGLSTSWALEGGANLGAREIERRVRGYPFDANTLAMIRGGGREGFLQAGPLWRFNQPDTGPFDVDGFSVYGFLWGYDSSEWLLRAFAHRLAAAGLSWNTALGLVLSGSLYGWGGMATGEPGRGLTSRMRSHLGMDWDPVQGALQAWLATVADDRNPSATYQIPSILDLWRYYYSAGNVAAGSGASIERLGGQKAFGYFHVSGEDHGGSYQYGSDLDGVEWMLLRIR